MVGLILSLIYIPLIPYLVIFKQSVWFYRKSIFLEGWGRNWSKDRMLPYWFNRTSIVKWYTKAEETDIRRFATDSCGIESPNV